MTIEHRIETCPHCGFHGSYNNLKKEHYDNCVFKHHNDFVHMYETYLKYGLKGSLPKLNIPRLSEYKLKEILKFKNLIIPIKNMNDDEFINYIKRLNSLKISTKNMDRDKVCRLGGYSNYDESLYAIINDHVKNNVCAICQKSTQFGSISRGYNITCSKSCQAKLRASHANEESRKKASDSNKKTMLNNHGIINVSQKNIKNLNQLRDIEFLKNNFLSEDGYVLSKEFNEYFNTSSSMPYKIFNELDIEYTKGSAIQAHLNKWLNDMGIETIYSDRTVIKPFELDIVIPNFKLAIEYGGIYWHRHGNKNDKNYHFTKLKNCREKGYSLVTLFDSDDLNKAKLLILSRLGLLKIVYARKCTIKEISKNDTKIFNLKYHLGGHVNGSINLGLFDNDGTLLQIMSFGKSRFNKNYQFELLRFTSGEVSVVGGASKLFKYFNNNYNPTSIISYCDLRFGTGGVYEKLGFKDDGFTGVNYKYIVNGVLYSREKYQKHKLKNILKSYDENISEYQNMLNNKFDKIYDCGNQRYVWINTTTR
jgi:hypothetical protein